MIQRSRRCRFLSRCPPHSAGTSRVTGGRTGLLLGLGAGVGFGLFFIGLDATPPDSGLWPLLAGRATSAVLLGSLVVARRSTRAVRPSRLVIISGVFVTTANVWFLLATRAGDLDVSAVVV